MREYLNELRSRHHIIEIIYLILGITLILWLVVPSISATRYETEIGDITIKTATDISWQSVTFAKRGLISLNLKPLVEFVFKAHDAPINLYIQPETLNEKTILSIVSDGADVKALVANVQKEFKAAINQFILKSVLLSFVLAILWGIFNSALISSSKLDIKQKIKSTFIPVFVSVSTTGIIIMVLFTWIFVSQEPNPFSNYQIKSSLKSVESFNRGMPNLESNWTNYTKNLALLVKESYNFSEGIKKEQFPIKQVGFLILSDIHNNTILSEVIADKMKKDDIKAMIVAGDITNTGSEIESSIVSALFRSKKPVYIVGGNHDSETMLSSIDESSAIWLDRQNIAKKQTAAIDVFSLENISIAGINDPFFYAGDHTNYISSVQLAANQIDKLITKSKIDILVVHNPKQAEKFSGKFPVIINGHTHTPSLEINGSTIQIDPGTAGAIPPFYQNEEGTYINKRLAFAVLYFIDNKPAYIERFFFDIKYGQIEHYSIEHTSLN